MWPENNPNSTLTISMFQRQTQIAHNILIVYFIYGYTNALSVRIRDVL